MNQPFELFVLLPGIILVFSFVFWLTSKDDRCWYRRYLLPLMLASFIFVLPEWWAKIIALVSAALVYDGYKGYGREIQKIKKEGK